MTRIHGSKIVTRERTRKRREPKSHTKNKAETKDKRAEKGNRRPQAQKTRQQEDTTAEPKNHHGHQQNPNQVGGKHHDRTKIKTSQSSTRSRSVPKANQHKSGPQKNIGSKQISDYTVNTDGQIYKPQKQETT